MRLNANFWKREALEIAPDLLGKYLVRRFKEGKVEKKIITEVEVYMGEKDLASHARFGKTKRNALMYESGGIVYVYLIYGIFWLINIITGEVNNPQAILIRGVEGIKGPGRVGKWLHLDKSFYGENLETSKRIWIEENKMANKRILKSRRIGVEYAGIWAKKKWRFILLPL